MSRHAGRVPLNRMGARMLAGSMRSLFTTNGHGICPVYCIKFDQTGQFIFTGADDGLVKVRFVEISRYGSGGDGGGGYRPMVPVLVPVPPVVVAQ